MQKMKAVPIKEHALKSITFRVVVEPDNFPDGERAFHAYIPALRNKGGSTWGYTIEEALTNIREVAELVIEDMVDQGESIPTDSENGVSISEEPLVTVTLTA